MSARRKQAMRQGIQGFSAGVAITLLLFVLAAVGVAWVYNSMVAQERWPIRWLEIDGSFERVSAEQVRASLAPLVKGSFFTVNASIHAVIRGEFILSSLLVSLPVFIKLHGGDMNGKGKPLTAYAVLHEGTIQTAVQLKCYSCQHYSAYAVEKCKYAHCPLHPYRKGDTDTTKSGRAGR